MKLLNKINKIKKINNESWTVTLEFEDRYRGVSDLSDIFSRKKPGPLVLEILRGNFFDKCFIESGHLAWPNGFELCADTLRMRAEEYAKKKLLRACEGITVTFRRPDFLEIWIRRLRKMRGIFSVS